MGPQGNGYLFIMYKETRRKLIAKTKNKVTQDV